MRDHIAQIIIASVALGVLISDLFHRWKNKSKIHEINCSTQYELIRNDITGLSGSEGLILLIDMRNNAMDFFNEYGKKVSGCQVKYNHLMKLCAMKEAQIFKELKEKESPLQKG